MLCLLSPQAPFLCCFPSLNKLFRLLLPQMLVLELVLVLV